MNDMLLKQTQSIASRLAPKQSDAERCGAEQDLRALALRSSVRALRALTTMAASKAAGVVMRALSALTHREPGQRHGAPALR